MNHHIEDLEASALGFVAHQLTWLAVQDYDLSAEVARLDQQVLIYWGEDDPVALPGSHKRAW